MKEILDPSGERLVSVRDDRTSAERLSSDRHSRRSIQRLSPVRNTRTSVDLLTSNRDSSRLAQRLESVGNTRGSAKQPISDRNFIRSVERLASVRSSRTSAERLASERDSRRSTERLTSVRSSRISAERLASNRASGRSVERTIYVRDSRRSLEPMTSFRKSQRFLTEELSSVRNSRRTSVERLTSARNSMRMVLERRSVSRQSSPDRLATRRLMISASAKIIFPERRVLKLEHLSIIHIASNALDRGDAARMSNVRHSNNLVLYPNLKFANKPFSIMGNTTLKTESFLGIGLPLETVQNTALSFKPAQPKAQHASWSANVVEYLRSALTTLTVMWSTLSMWKGNVFESLASSDVASTFSAKMDHLNSFFFDKPITNYAVVPDDLALYGSTKATSPITRDRNGILTTMIVGGATAAFMLLSTRAK